MTSARLSFTRHCKNDTYGSRHQMVGGNEKKMRDERISKQGSVDANGAVWVPRVDWRLRSSFRQRRNWRASTNHERESVNTCSRWGGHGLSCRSHEDIGRTSETISFQNAGITQKTSTDFSRLSCPSNPARYRNETITCVSGEVPELDGVDRKRQNEDTKHEERRTPTNRT